MLAVEKMVILSLNQQEDMDQADGMDMAYSLSIQNAEMEYAVLLPVIIVRKGNMDGIQAEQANIVVSSNGYSL